VGNTEHPVLGNLNAQMLIKTGKKRASKGIITKMAKNALVRENEL